MSSAAYGACPHQVLKDTGHRRKVVIATSSKWTCSRSRMAVNVLVSYVTRQLPLRWSPNISVDAQSALKPDGSLLRVYVRQLKARLVFSGRELRVSNLCLNVGYWKTALKIGEHPDAGRWSLPSTFAAAAYIHVIAHERNEVSIPGAFPHCVLRQFTCC